ncbi:hypothetical protein CHS0354_003919 [Potamilus streckersoni]|uniref:Uncharacterized protein n=1 Tax=Potamilus streckersoni TaxID=2493646 RepID=A0AAE0S459_9BIVA|nr:hypothetical protein CHS0354_003919 [Potamilus streckersoni]
MKKYVYLRRRARQSAATTDPVVITTPELTRNPLVVTTPNKPLLVLTSESMIGTVVVQEHESALEFGEGNKGIRHVIDDLSCDRESQYNGEMQAKEPMAVMEPVVTESLLVTPVFNQPVIIGQVIVLEPVGDEMTAPIVTAVLKRENCVTLYE